MTAVQRRRRTAAGIAALLLSPTLIPHLVKGDGLWLLTVLVVGVWAATNFRTVR